jgi:hypothetical protein
MAGFDVEGARKAGYSEAEIVDHLAAERKFDVGAARKSGYSDAELLTHLREPLARPEGTKEKDTSLTGMLGAYGRGVVNAFGTADEMRAGSDALVQGARNLFGGDGPSMGEAYDQSLAANRAQLDADREQHPVASTAGQIAGGVGASLYAAPAAAAARLPALAAPVLSRINPLLQRLPGFARTAGRVVGGGAAVGGGTGFAEGEGGLDQRLGSAAIGAGVGAGVGTLAHGGLAAGNKMLNPVRVNLSPEALRIRAVARAGGVQTSVAQETGSPYLKNIEASLAKLPGSAGMEANSQRIQNEAYTRHGMSFAGENVDNTTPATLNASAARSGGEIGRIANSYNLDASSPQFLNDLVAAADKARGFAATDVERQTLARINSIVDKVQAGDIIPGQTYRELRSELGETMRNTQDGDLRHHLRGVMKTLDDAFAKSIPAGEKDAFDKARREYANLHVIADAMGGAGAATARGQLSPLRLASAVDASTGGGYAWGQGDLNDWARVGQELLRAPPDPGTAGLSEANKLLTGSLVLGSAGAGFGIGGPIGMAVGAAAPFVLPSMAHSFMNSRAGRAWLVNGLGHIPQEFAGAGAAVARNRLLQD